MTKNRVRIKHAPKDIILDGVNELADAVSSTLGASGRNVMIQSREQEHPHITKDGVTVAKSITFLNPAVDAAASVLRSASEKTSVEAGDGTTTTVVLARAMIEGGFKSISKGYNPMQMRDGMDMGCNLVVSYIEKHKKDCLNNNILDIAKISANGDGDIAKEVALTIEKVGAKGDITLRPSLSGRTFTEITEGAIVESGWASPYFADQGNKNQECIMEDPLIFLTNTELSKLADVEPILSYASSGKRSVLIIAPDINGEAFSVVLANSLNPQIPLKACVVTSPYIGELRHAVMEDIAAVTGAIYFSDEKGLPIKKVNQMKGQAFGTCKRVVVGKDKTIFVGTEPSDEYFMRIAELEARAGAEPSESTMINRRLNMIKGKVAVINVGGNSPAEVNERIDRFDDAVCACKSAMEEGIVPGGGVVYLRAIMAVNDFINALQKMSDKSVVEGVRVVANALKAPFVTMMRNAGYRRREISIFANKVLNVPFEKGINITNGAMVNMINSGIIDPAKVLRVSIVNATSVASMLLTTDCMIFDDLAYIDSVKKQNELK